MLAASLAADVPLFIASPTSAWASAGASFVPSPVIATRWPSACWRADEGDLVLGLGLGDEVVDAGLAGDRRRGQRVVAGDHDRPDAHPAELGEALGEARLDRVLELDDAEGAPSRRIGERRRAAAGDRVGLGLDLGRQRRRSGRGAMASTAPLRTWLAGREPDAARAGLGAERLLLGDPRVEGARTRPRRRRRRGSRARRGGGGRARRSSGPRASRPGARRRARPRARRPRRRPGAGVIDRGQPVAVGDRARSCRAGSRRRRPTPRRRGRSSPAR